MHTQTTAVVPTLIGADVDLSEHREIENRHIRVLPYGGAVEPTDELSIMLSMALQPAEYGYDGSDDE